VLPLDDAALYHRGGSRLVFALRTPTWQVNLSAKDEAERDRWVAAFAELIPTATLRKDGTVQEPARPPRRPRAAATELGLALTRLKALQAGLADAEAQLRAAQRGADRAVGLAIQQVRAVPSTPKGSGLLSRLLPDRSGEASPAWSASPRVSVRASTPAAARLVQLRELNGAVRRAVGQRDGEIRSLQRTVVLLSSAAGWAWATRISGTRTLWDVWSEAVCTLRRIQASLPSPRQPTSRIQGGGAEDFAPPKPSVWSALDSAQSNGVGLDRNASSTLRKDAHERHGDDWFISMASRLFEL